jgi:hypothetical protein
MHQEAYNKMFLIQTGKVISYLGYLVLLALGVGLIFYFNRTVRRTVR